MEKNTIEIGLYAIFYFYILVGFYFALSGKNEVIEETIDSSLKQSTKKLFK